MAESKFRENLRYLGYAIGTISGMLILALLFLYLDPIIAFLWAFIHLIALIMFILALILAVFYLILSRKRG
jgi:hypothetical protein